MFHTPAHKQTDIKKMPGQEQEKTLGDYYKRKYPKDMLPSFEEWLDSVYVELNGKTFTRRDWWTDGEIAAANEAWNARNKP